MRRGLGGMGLEVSYKNFETLNDAAVSVLACLFVQDLRKSRSSSSTKRKTGFEAWSVPSRMRFWGAVRSVWLCAASQASVHTADGVQGTWESKRVLLQASDGPGGHEGVPMEPVNVPEGPAGRTRFPRHGLANGIEVGWSPGHAGIFSPSAWS